ncbi:conjugal transfer protein TraF [Helicobacter sp. 23-1048]
MKKLQRIIALALSFSAFLFGLEFGTMGGVSSGIGGAGVAVKNSAWGIYYNPALLGADKRSKLGFSFGVQVKDQNIGQAAGMILDPNSDIKGFSKVLQEKLLDPVSSGSGKTTTFMTTTSATATTTAQSGSVNFGTTKVEGVFASALMKLFGVKSGGTIDETKLKEFANKVGCQNCNGNDLNTIAKELQKEAKDNPDLQNKIKDEVSTAANATGSGLLSGIVNGLSGESISNIIEKISEGKGFKAEDILAAAGSITIPRGTDADVDKILDAFVMIDNTLQTNNINISTQNGLVFQMGGAKPKKYINVEGVGKVEVSEDKRGRGAIAIAILPQSFVNASAIIDKTHNQLIIGVGKNGADCDSLNPTAANCDYFGLSVSGSGVNFAKKGEQDFNNNSILSSSANHRISGTMLSIIELPVGYGHTIYTSIGNINIGLAGKFIKAFGYTYDSPLKVNDLTGSLVTPKGMDLIQQETHTFGADLGVLYTPSFAKKLNLGLVVKNINAPKIAFTTRDFILNRQVRFGASYELSRFLTFAFDMDLLPNDTLSLTSPYSQTIGGGVLADFKYVDFKFGAMKDLRSQYGEGVILTGGINALGIDVSVQYGLGQNPTIYGYTLSNYLALRIGAQWSF